MHRHAVNAGGCRGAEVVQRDGAARALRVHFGGGRRVALDQGHGGGQRHAPVHVDEDGGRKGRGVEGDVEGLALALAEGGRARRQLSQALGLDVQRIKDIGEVRRVGGEAVNPCDARSTEGGPEAEADRARVLDANLYPSSRDVLEGGKGGFGWHSPPPSVPLWSPPKAGRTF